MADRPPSQIPVPVSRRASFTASVLQQSTNAINAIPAARAPSPLTLSKPPPAGKHTHSRRQSLLSSTGSRKTSISDGASDDPVYLKAQIALLKTSLQASHQRIVDLTTSMALNSSTGSSVATGIGGPRGSPLPWTPVNGLMGLPEVDGLPGGEPSPSFSVAEDVEGEEEQDPTAKVRPQSAAESSSSSASRQIPHSSSSYDLRSRAVTPGKLGFPPPDKNLDPRLGLSRIPHSVVTHVVGLHNSPARSPSSSTQPLPRAPSPSAGSTADATLLSPFLNPNSPQTPYTSTDGASLGLGQPTSSSTNGRLSPAPDPALRRSSGPGGSAASTKVIDGLQTELLNTRTQLERVKQDVRGSRRVIDQLTRQTEDLKETRERMRVECEGLNNVIARKERLLQEVLERARTAEASLQQHVSTRKTLEQSTKKSLQQMTVQLGDAQVAQQKAERESTSLRDGVKSLRDAWSREVKGLREEWRRSEEKQRAEREEARMKHLALVKLVQSQSADRQAIQQLATEALEQRNAVAASFETKTSVLRAQLESSLAENRAVRQTAQDLAGELVRLRRMMREPIRADLNAIAAGSEEGGV